MCPQELTMMASHLPNAITTNKAQIEDEIYACSHWLTGVDINLNPL
jgi:hypothetical protein